jgi:hypothetical protein
MVDPIISEGNPSVLHNMDLLKKVQRVGKNLQIFLNPLEVETALENLLSKGLFITTCCKTEEDARDLLKIVAKLSKLRNL